MMLDVDGQAQRQKAVSVICISLGAAIPLLSSYIARGQTNTPSLRIVPPITRRRHSYSFDLT